MPACIPQVFFLLAFSTLLAVPVVAQEEPPELAQARLVYEKELAFATRPIRERYLLRLETMKRTLGGRGDVRAALAVQEEIDRALAAALLPGLAKYSGSWLIQYENGGTRRYLIKADGSMTWVETDGKPQGDTPGKMRPEGPDAVIELPFFLERLSFSGDRLVVEHFAPKSDYPRKVTQRGTGVKQGGK